MKLHPPEESIKKSRQIDGTSFALTSGLRQGARDGAEGVADFGSQQTHNSNHDDGYERKNDRVLDQALAFFFGCKQHSSNSFLTKKFLPEDHPQSYIKYNQFAENFKPL